LISFLVKGR